MAEGLVSPARIMHRLAEGKFEMETVLGLEAGSLERSLHRRNVPVVEPDGLQVGKAPPGFAQAGGYQDSLAVGRDRLVQPIHGLQHVTVAGPDARQLRLARQNGFVEPHRLLEVAQTPERRSLQVQMPDVVRLRSENLVYQAHCFGRSPA